jgi:hypothetical protein
MYIPTEEEVEAFVSTRRAAMEKAGIDPSSVDFRLDDIYTKMFDLAAMLALLLEYHGIRRFNGQ